VPGDRLVQPNHGFYGCDELGLIRGGRGDERCVRFSCLSSLPICWAKENVSASQINYPSLNAFKPA